MIITGVCSSLGLVGSTLLRPHLRSSGHISNGAEDQSGVRGSTRVPKRAMCGPHDLEPSGQRVEAQEAGLAGLGLVL